jgi:predicted CXXCH cytochrome family protein
MRAQNLGNYTLWWDKLPDQVRSQRVETGPFSNIHPADYAGPDACKGCHPQQYGSWSNHPHRWMNARVEDTVIHGDFNDSRLSYLGGDVTFFRSGTDYRMRLARGGVQREFNIEQTIGSRYFQYYVGKQLEGPEPPDHPLYSDLHVLPLGCWLDRKEWVPVVHIEEEGPDGTRHDPFVPRPPLTDLGKYIDDAPDLYRSSCNFCHTTFAVGDMFVRMQHLLGEHLPTKVDLSLEQYVKGTRPQLWPEGRTPSEMSNDEFITILRTHHAFDASEEAVTLGVSCEACHLGAKEHAQGKLKRPRFFPTAPELVVRSSNQSKDYDVGRTPANLNYACARCHTGGRPTFANGIHTWNSTEFTDASLGSCYSQLTCVNCHNPHEATGKKWTRTPAQDDASCLQCHSKFEPDAARLAHTHHPLDTEGSRCMNCHMPHINEGLQDVVRTHTIFSPTDRTMIETNQLNACNLCHGDKPIDWTLAHLKDWYGKTYADSNIAASYPRRSQPVALGWLKSKHESIRLVAADSLTRTDSRWALPQLVEALDDDYLLNRQFARIGLESMLGTKLSDFGYRFYMTRDERAEPLQRIRDALLKTTAQRAERRPRDSGD